MSIHFAPQWVKPIKPSGGSATTPGAAEQSPTALNSSQTHHQKSQPTSTNTNSSTQVPFPALSGSSLNSPVALSSSGAAPNPPMSYSRATHTPASPGFPNDGSYFPSSERSNGSARDPHPFRYTREQIMGLYDEEKFKGMPIEFVDLLDRGLSVVAPQPRRPLGMGEMSEAQKKILSTSVHPPMPRRPAQPAGGGNANASGGGGQAQSEPHVNGHTSRRSTANVTRDPTQPNGRGFTGGFGRGEGGALAGAIGKPGVIGGGVVPPPGEGKAPGVLGGGFGGVGKRGVLRGRNDAVEGSAPSDGVRPWRGARNASGNFEGVLGFNGPQTATPSHAPAEENEDSSVEISQQVPQTAPITGGWRERLAAKQQEAKKETPAPEQVEGLASPWSGTQKQWRAPIGQDGPSVPLELPIANAPTSMSVIASPAATPVPDRDATIDLTTPGPPPRAQQPPQPEQETSQEVLDAVKWYYLDPQQQQHGPFVATQMHDWYSQSYFEDALPVRRDSETNFYPLGELKLTTGNPVRPFVSAPRPPPPSVPEHQNMARQQSIPPQLEPFRDLAIGQQFSPDPRFNPNSRMPMQQFPQQPFRNEPGFPSNQFPPQQGFPQQFQSPGFVNAAPGPQWGAMAAHQGLHSRLNGDAFGTPGMLSPIGAMPAPFPPPNAFSPSVNQGLNRAPDFFSPSIGVGSIPTSPWAANGQPQGPQPHQLQQPFQEQPHAQHQQSINSGSWQQASPMQPMSQSQSQSIDQPSYFPSDGQEASAPVESQEDQSGHESESQVEDLLAEDPVIASQQPEPSPQDAEVATPVEKPTGPPASAWAPVPAVSRKSSVAADPLPSAVTDTTEPQTPSKLAPAPASASLPSKPVAARKQSVSEIPPSTPAATATAEKAAPKPAPWASDKEVKTPSGPSLREIQQAESKVAEARKQALAEARANNAVPSPALSTTEDMPTSMSWGLPAQNSKGPQVSTPTAAASPSTPVWGSGEAAAPKKTLKQIQEEEKKRSVKLAQAKAQAQGITAGPAATSTPASKRGYADLAATSAPPGAGWQTVGASKGVPGSASPAPGSRVASVAKPAAVSAPTKAAPAPVSRVVKPAVDDSTPSVEFIRWTKQALTGLDVNIDEFIQMLLSFPIDPPASERAGQLEIISDSVYSGSSTLDGRRFAQEFCTRRKADAKRSSAPNTNGNAPVKATSLADVLKTQPKPQSSDAGFKVVKPKGKKKN